MRYPWSVSASRKYRNAHWMALRWDGETMKNDVFRGTGNALQSDLAENTGTR